METTRISFNIVNYFQHSFLDLYLTGTKDFYYEMHPWHSNSLYSAVWTNSLELFLSLHTSATIKFWNAWICFLEKLNFKKAKFNHEFWPCDVLANQNNRNILWHLCVYLVRKHFVPSWQEIQKRTRKTAIPSRYVSMKPFSVQEPCRNFRIPCPFLYSRNGICTELHGNRNTLYSIAERTRNYTELEGIRTESARFCIPCQLGLLLSLL